MKVLIKSNIIRVTQASCGGRTWAEKESNYCAIDSKYRKALLEISGKWLEVETKFLFEDQFNIAKPNIRMYWYQIEKIDFAPEFRGKDEFLAAVQKRYDKDRPGRKVNRYYIDQLTK